MSTAIPRWIHRFSSEPARLSNVRAGQYVDGRPPRNTGCCRLYAFAHQLLFLLIHIFHFPNIFSLIFWSESKFCIVLISFFHFSALLSTVNSKTVNKKHVRAVRNFIFAFVFVFAFCFVFGFCFLCCTQKTSLCLFVGPSFAYRYCDAQMTRACNAFHLKTHCSSCFYAHNLSILNAHRKWVQRLKYSILKKVSSGSLNIEGRGIRGSKSES